MRQFVIVIEDDLDLGSSIVEVLEMLDFEAEIYRDGDSALRRMSQRSPDVALVDIHLPGMSGLDILRKIRANSALSGIKTIILTADVFLSEDDKKLADSIIFKPYSINELSKAVAPVRSTSR